MAQYVGVCSAMCAISPAIQSDEIADEVRNVWASRWWLDPQYVSVYGDRISPGEVDVAIRRVSEVFDSKWAATVGKHAYLPNVLATGLIPLQFLYSLGEDLLAVDDSLRLGAVLKDLKHPSNCASARLELEFAAHLRRAGHIVEFRPRLPNGKESDCVARCEGQEVYFEIKRLQESQKQIAIGNLIHAVAMALSDLTRTSQNPQIRDHSYRIELDDFSARLGKGTKNDQDLIGQVTALIISNILHRAESEMHLDFAIPSVASIYIGDTRDESASIVGVLPTPDAEMRRILGSHFFDALEQIHPENPGIVVIQTPASLDRPAVEATVIDLFERGIAIGEHLSTVLFLPVYYTIPETWSIFRSFPVLNPKARYPAVSLKAFHDLRTIYEAKARTVGH